MLQVTLLPTLVSPEWTSAAASHLNNLQACTCTAQLWQEAALIEQIIYKNINQHRNTRPFQRILEVRRFLRLLQDASTDDTVCSFREALSLCSRPTLSLHERQVPTVESALHVIQRVLGSCRLAESLVNATLTAAAQFTTQLAQSFFMPLSLTCLAILARVRALGAQLLVDLIRLYNCCIELIALLPLGTTNVDNHKTNAGDTKHENSETIWFSSSLKRIPQMLRCSWNDGRPTVIQSKVDNSNINDNSGGSDGSSIGVEMGGIQRPKPIGAIAIGRKAAESKVLAGNKQKSKTAPPPSDLAVIEDRGVSVSREQLMAELRLNAAQTAIQTTQIEAAVRVNSFYNDDKKPTPAHELGVAAVDGQPPPEYARTEVDIITSTAKGASLLKRKVEKRNKRAMGPKIKIIPSELDIDDGSGGGGGGSLIRIQSAGGTGSLSGDATKVSRPRLEPLPPRSTAFISVETLQKKPKIEEKKEISENKGGKGGLASLPPAAAAAVEDVSAAGVKSWEDWLAPLGSPEKKQQGGSSSKKKARRR